MKKKPNIIFPWSEKINLIEEVQLGQIKVCSEELKNFCQIIYVSRLLSFLENTVWSWLFQQVNNQYNTAGLSSRLNINLLYGYNLNPLHKFYGINCNTQIDELGKDKTFNKKGYLCLIVLE